MSCLLHTWSVHIGQQKPISRIVYHVYKFWLVYFHHPFEKIRASQTENDFPKSLGEHDKQSLKPALSTPSFYRVVATLKTADIRTCLWNLSHPCVQNFHTFNHLWPFLIISVSFAVGYDFFCTELVVFHNPSKKTCASQIGNLPYFKVEHKKSFQPPLSYAMEPFQWINTPPKFNSSPLKNDAWKMSFLLGPCLSLGAFAVEFPGRVMLVLNPSLASSWAFWACSFSLAFRWRARYENRIRKFLHASHEILVFR